MLSILFQSHLIRRSGTERTLRGRSNTQGTRKSLGGNLDTRALDTLALKAVGHSDT